MTIAFGSGARRIQVHKKRKARKKTVNSKRIVLFFCAFCSRPRGRRWWRRALAATCRSRPNRRRPNCASWTKPRPLPQRAIDAAPGRAPFAFGFRAFPPSLRFNPCLLAHTLCAWPALFWLAACWPLAPLPRPSARHRRTTARPPTRPGPSACPRRPAMCCPTGAFTSSATTACRRSLTRSTPPSAAITRTCALPPPCKAHPPACPRWRQTPRCWRP